MDPIIKNTAKCHAFRRIVDPPEYWCFGVKNSPYVTGDPNLVGCRCMGLDLSPYANKASSVYKTGEWVDVFGTYAFDIAAMAARTEKMIRKYGDCHLLDVVTARRFIELWPEQVNVVADSQWHYWPVSRDPLIKGLSDVGMIGLSDVEGASKPRCAVVSDVSFFDDFLKKLYSNGLESSKSEAIHASLRKIQTEIRHFL